jgi:small GTP-binding protein
VEGILTTDQQAVLDEERRLLNEVAAELQADDASRDDLATLDLSVAQLDELFLLVVVGEFNAGKSALLNALLGTDALAEGVTPTTSRIHVLRWGEAPGTRRLDEVTDELTAPVPLLREVTLVDTPGTNALDREHERLTADFVPRSDLVLFVTSADRPFSESERRFLQSVREWRKKVLVVLNKVDLLTGEGDLEQVLGFIHAHGVEVLGEAPQVLPVSAREAGRARASGDAAALEASGLPRVESAVRDVLDRGERLRLKLGNPLGVASTLVERAGESLQNRLGLLAGDVATLDDIDRQLVAYADDVSREFELRLAAMDGLLQGLELRGIRFFDERLRLAKVFDLFDSDRLRQDFAREVVADMPIEMDAKAESLIDWLVESDLNQWQRVVGHVQKRQSIHADRVVGEIGARFDSNRSTLLESLGRAAREGVRGYDREAEAQRLASDVQKAVAGTAVVEVGAVGLGATVAMLATGSAADATGIAAAGLLAAVGLYILPHRRKRAKAELKARVEALRAEVMASLRQHFAAEAGRSQGRIRNAIAPYVRFVRSEREHLERRRDVFAELRRRLADLDHQLQVVTADGDQSGPE